MRGRQDTYEVVELSRVSLVWTVYYVGVYRFVRFRLSREVIGSSFQGIQVSPDSSWSMAGVAVSQGGELVFFPRRVSSACGLRQLTGLRRNCRYSFSEDPFSSSRCSQAGCGCSGSFSGSDSCWGVRITSFPLSSSTIRVTYTPRRSPKCTLHPRPRPLRKPPRLP